MDGPNSFLSATIGGSERQFPIEPSSICRIGRDQNNNVVLIDALASRSHAMVQRDSAGNCFLLDVGSRNGTRLNGRPVSVPVALTNGDSILIGDQVITFHQHPTLRVVENHQQTHPVTQFMLAQSLISVLVVDIRGYTTLSQDLGEERISGLMSELFRTAGQILEARSAWSQKYLGDAIMGVWLHQKPHIEARELLAMLDVTEKLRETTEALSRRFNLRQPLRFGAAINSGYASIGNMGSANLADFTALGDTVNKAFRLEAASKDLGRDLVLGWRTVELLHMPRPAILSDAAGEVTLRGYSAPECICSFGFDELPFLMQALSPERLLRPAPEWELRAAV